MDKVKVFKAFKLMFDNINRDIPIDKIAGIEEALREFELFLEACPHGLPADKFCHDCDVSDSKLRIIVDWEPYNNPKLAAINAIDHILGDRLKGEIESKGGDYERAVSRVTTWAADKY